MHGGRLMALAGLLAGLLAAGAAGAAAGAGPHCRLASPFGGDLTLPAPLFRAAACAVCYRFLNRELLVRPWHLLAAAPGPGPPLLLLSPQMNRTVEADAEQPDPDLVGSFRADRPGPAMWMQCCAAAAACCNRHLAAGPEAAAAAAGCPRLWDGWQCWEAAAPDSDPRRPCPAYISGEADLHCFSLSASRRCHAEGRWANLSDYSTCSSLQVRWRENAVLLAAYAVSCAALLPALAVLLLLYRQPHGNRIALHRSLFLSLLLHAAADSLLRGSLLLPELRLRGSSAARENGVWCRLLVAATLYLRSCTYMWMFCEGFYLHRLLAASFSSEGRMIVYHCIGWGLPLAPAGAYAGLRLWFQHRDCWLRPSHRFEWLLLGPNLLSLLVNAVFLVRILLVLNSVLLRTAPAREPAHYRQSVRAALLLLPLLGGQNLLTVFRPPPVFCAWSRVHLYASHLLDGLQGATVALIYCFCNGEVHELARRACRTLADRYRYQPGLRPSRGSHSLSTAQANL